MQKRSFDVIWAAVQDGEESGLAEGDVFAEVRERIHQRATQGKRMSVIGDKLEAQIKKPRDLDK